MTNPSLPQREAAGQNHSVSARDQIILDLFASGMLIKNIALKVGMAANSVGIVLKRHDIPRPAKPQKSWKDVDEDKVHEVWDSGLSTSAIAERFGVDRARIIKILKARGVDPDSVRRQRYDGEGGTIDRSGGAFARIARRT